MSFPTSNNTLTPLQKELHDFRRFLYIIWGYLNLPSPTPVQYEIASYLQHGPRRKIIEAFRGVGKSWITSAYVTWMLRMNPQYNFLVVSASKSRADDFSTFTLRLINEMPLLQCLIPRDEQRKSKIAFDVNYADNDHAPSVKSVGIFGQLAGSRADEIIADDIEVPNNSMTQQMRDRLSEAVKEFDAILKPNGKVTYLGTPQTEQTLYNILPTRGYNTRIWPVKFPNEKLLDYYGDKLAPSIKKIIEEKSLNKTYHLIEGKSIDPKRFNELDLMEREASYGKAGFSLQFMLDTSLSDQEAHPLKINDLIVIDTDIDKAPEKVIWTNNRDNIIEDLPCVGFNGDRYYSPLRFIGEWIDYHLGVMAIDPSGRGSNETSYAVIKSLNSYLFLTASGGLQGGYNEEVLTKLVEIAKENKVNKIIIESNFGDGMFTALITPYVHRIYPNVLVEEVRHNIQKEKRIIDTVEPVMNQHRLIVNRQVIKDDYYLTTENNNYSNQDKLKYQLMYQLSHITRDRGSLAIDDRLDAMSMAIAEHTKLMNRDAELLIEKRKEELLMEELEMFIDNTKTRPLMGFNHNSYQTNKNKHMSIMVGGNAGYKVS